MPLASRRARRSSIDIWPGFVDALAQLLIVIIFMLLVFTAGQFFLSNALSGRDKALKQLQRQVSQLSNLLSLERGTNTRLETRLRATLAERNDLKSRLGALRTRAAAAEKALAAEKRTSLAARSQVEQLTMAVAMLREQLAQIAKALDVSEAKVKAQQTQIADLGKKLNLALANKVQELARYRSEFFGKLRQIIGNRPDIRIVGDRFVFQAEVLFKQGSADLSPAAKKQLDPVVTALKEIGPQIPKDIHWVLRVDGHTDRTPIDTPQFPSNWELSTERAISVVRYMIAQGIPRDRLVAAGFADTQPIDPGNTPEAYRRNRRIELRLTTR